MGDQVKALYQISYQERKDMGSGEILFENKNLFELETEERAHKGIFLAFQYPIEIPGVNTNIFLKTSLNAVRKARGEKELDAIEFLKLVKEKSKELKFDEEKLNRQLNLISFDFSFTSFKNSIASSSFSPLAFLTAFNEVFKKILVFTPGISIGY